jgi:FKBP-type peptidyl-prolyl cis-trans isomerase
MIARIAVLLAVAVALAACQRTSGSSTDETDETPEVSPDVPTVPGHPPPPGPLRPPSDALATELGARYKAITPGDGASPGPNDAVEVHYQGWRPNGEQFIDSHARGRPQTMVLSQTPPVWREAIQTMKVGQKSHLWIPAKLAYEGRPGTPADDILFYEVELLAVTAGPTVPEDVATPPADGPRTASGYPYRVLAEGDGDARPRSWDLVTVHYTGWSPQGVVFDSTVTHGEPRTSPRDRMPDWLSEAIGEMVVGDKRRVWFPGDALEGAPPQAAGGLVFDLELVAVERRPDPPAAPKDVAAPPAGAQKTDKGVHYRVLARGKGKRKPTLADTIVVHYTGWTTDGAMFDSSVTGGQPLEMPLANMIDGWKDALSRMVPGDRWRLWIPQELAYRGQPGAPAGMLVFDVELLDIR